MIRARYQQGSVVRKTRKSGPDLWVYRFTENGHRRSIPIGTVEKYKSKGAAIKASEYLRIKANPDRAAERVITLGAMLDKYIAEDMPERYSTRTRYLPWLNLYIKPKWGEYALGEIVPDAVKEWLASLDLGPKSRAHIKSLMRIIYDTAMRAGLYPIQVNPLSLVRVRGCSATRKEARNLTVAEMQAVIQHVPPTYRTMVVVAACLGLRVSEIVGLQWGDIDFSAGCVLVRRALVMGREGDVKTKYSKKRLPLDPGLAQAILEHRGKYAVGTEATDWVFCNPDTMRPWWPHRIQSRWLRRAGKLAGVGEDIGWHTFRHSYSSLLRQLGVDLKVQQELMRHADISTTLNIYTQAVASDLRAANSKVVGMMLQ